MERQGYINGDYCRAWTAQFAPEKVGGDHFIVEELLDFSNEEDDGDMRIAAGDDDGGGAAGGSDVGRENCTADSPSVTTGDSSINFFAGGGDNQLNDELIFPRFTDGGFSGELCEPYEELAELEWLSNFVEDSFSGEEVHKQQLLSGIKSTSSQPTPNADYHFPAADDDNYPPPFTFDAPVPVKTRSKRTRTTPRGWSTRLLLLATITPSFPSETSDELQQSPIKKQARKKNPPAPADGRKCLHCASDKTPQWRSGPMGPKTLCNACGVRYKSGRLVPEYRPAASPTFVLCRHSNSHRKVMELRRQNEVQQHHLQFLPVYGGAVDAPAIAGGGDGFLIHQRLHADVSQVF